MDDIRTFVKTYVLIMEDIIFGLTINAGVLSEVGVDAVVHAHTQPHDEWEECENGCCHSKIGTGDFESIVFKRVPIAVGTRETLDKIDSIRDEVLELKKVAAQITATIQIPEEDMN